MKIIIRNLISTISKFKAAWIMNFAGITAALTALMFVGMQIVYENSFDNNHPNADRIYRLNHDEADEPFNVILARGVIRTIGQLSPKIESYATVMDFIDDNYIDTEINGEKHGFRELTIGIEPGYAKMFDFELISGDFNALDKKGNALINESLAKKMFGNTDVLGKTLKVNEDWGIDEGGELTIIGVYKDFPSNTQTKNAIYYTLNDIMIDDLECSNFIGWVMLSSPNDKAEIEELINEKMASLFPERTPHYSLESLKDVYYNNEQDEGFVKSGSAKSTTMLTIIALIVLLISAVNQTNFNIALIPKRIKSINIQKVLGNSVENLRLQLFVENIIIGILTWLTALIVVKLLNNTWLTSFLVPDDLSISSNIGVCIMVGIISIIINALSSLYPIIKLTSANPALVLKGSYGRSLTGQKLRFGLLVFQYFAAICFISMAICIWLQIRYMENSNYIIRENQIAVFQTNHQFGQKFELALQKLKENNAIENVALSSQLIGGCDSYNTRIYTYNGERMVFNNISCTSELLEVFNIPLIEGDGFQGKPDSEVVDDYFTNDCVISGELGSNFHVGDTIQGMFGAVKGVMDKNIRLKSYRKETMPIVFDLSKAEYLDYGYVRIAKGSNIKDAVNHIKKVITEIVPEMPLEIFFYDKIFENLYKKEIYTSATTVFMAILAVLIAIIGVFGMVTLDAEYKLQEIAVRKVFGAKNSDIITSVNLKYIKIVAVGFILSVPITYYVINNWQESFVEKVSLPWWLYALILIGASLLTIFIVTTQSVKSIFQNPIEGLRKE